MKPSLVIRHATQADIATIQQMAATVFPETYHKIVGDKQVEYMLDWMYNTTTLTNQFYEGVYFYIAEWNNEPVAYAAMGHLQGNTYKLHKLYILPSAQQLGIGKHLLATITKKVIELGGTELQLQVNRHNKAVEFYLKMGFEIIESIKFPVGEGYFMDDFIMNLQL
jgi:ribosomal protein S18 acetylase RimI-like enzyme